MTKLLYIDQPEMLTAEAKVIQILNLDEKSVIVLDQTIFYVQGGGQPGDKGLIHGSEGVFEVEKTVYNLEGEVHHIGYFKQGSIQAGEIVNLEIDSIFRLNNSKTHSAGHLIDLCISKLGLPLTPGKGYHYPEGSYVEYAVEISELSNFQNQLEGLQDRLQIEYDQLVRNDLPVVVKFDETKVFKGQSLRSVSFGGHAECPCGGTHVKSTKELAGFRINKIKLKQNTCKISYGLSV